MALIYGKCRIERAISDEHGVRFRTAAEPSVLAVIKRALAEDPS
jgi:hypothetical protein